MSHRNSKPKPSASKRTISRWQDRKAGVVKQTHSDYSKQTVINDEGFSKPKAVKLG